MISSILLWLCVSKHMCFVVDICISIWGLISYFRSMTSGWQGVGLLIFILTLFLQLDGETLAPGNGLDTKKKNFHYFLYYLTLLSTMTPTLQRYTSSIFDVNQYLNHVEPREMYSAVWDSRHQWLSAQTFGTDLFPWGSLCPWTVKGNNVVLQGEQPRSKPLYSNPPTAFGHTAWLIIQSLARTKWVSHQLPCCPLNLFKVLN